MSDSIELRKLEEFFDKMNALRLSRSIIVDPEN
jgi:hypothetical protein